MTVELSEQERDIIWGWYQSAAWESAVGKTDETFSLLEKLGIEADGMHLCLPILEHWIPEVRPQKEAERRAILAYCKRHPEQEEVKTLIQQLQEK